MQLTAEETEASATTAKAASELTMEVQEENQYPDTENIAVSPELSAVYYAANKVSADRYNQKVDNWRQNRSNEPIPLVNYT